MKQFVVKSGTERWDYDAPVAFREIVDYWVEFGNEKVKSFAYEKDAKIFAHKLNIVLNNK